MSLRRLLLALLPLLALAGALAPARAAESVGVRAAEHEKAGFGRIAFDWPKPVGFEAKIDGDTLSVHFARKFSARLDAVTKALDG